MRYMVEWINDSHLKEFQIANSYEELHECVFFITSDKSDAYRAVEEAKKMKKGGMWGYGHGGISFTIKKLEDDEEKKKKKSNEGCLGIFLLFAIPIITAIICIVLWIFYFEWVANSNMPAWLKFVLLK